MQYLVAAFNDPLFPFASKLAAQEQVKVVGVDVSADNIVEFPVVAAASQPRPLNVVAVELNPGDVAIPGSSIFSGAMSALGSCLGWAGAKAKSAAKAAAPHAVSWAMNGSTQRIRKEVNVQAALINQMTGTPHLSATILRVSPKIGAYVTRLLKEWPIVEWVSKQGDIQSIIDGTLMQATVNLLHYSNDHPLPGQEKHAHPALHILSRLLYEVSAHLPGIDRQLESFNPLLQDQNAAARLNIYQSIVGPFAQSLLDMAFPNGQDDIKAPYPVNKVIWMGMRYALLDANSASMLLSSQIPQEDLADIFDQGIEAYRQIKEPLDECEANKSLIRAMPGGSELIGLIHQTVVDIAPKHAGGWVAANHRFLAECVFSLTDVAGNDSKATQAWLKSWLAHRIREYGEMQSEEVEAFHGLVGRYVESVFYRYILKMIEEGAEEGDITPRILAKIVGVVSRSVHNNHARINALLAEANQCEGQAVKLPNVVFDVGDERKRAELLSLFSPISTEILNTVGLREASDLPGPPYLSDIIFHGLQEVAPAIFFKIYTQAGLYLELMKPKPLPVCQQQNIEGQGELEVVARQLWEMHAPDIKQVVAGSKEGIAEFVVCQVQELVPRIDLGEDGRAVCASVIEQMALTRDADLVRAVDFVEGQLQEFFVRIVSHLAASYPVLREYEVQGRPKEVISCALSHILCIGGKHLQGLDVSFHQALDELMRLEKLLDGDADEENILPSIEEKLEEIYALFVPLAEEIVHSTGLDSNPWARLLKEKALPVLLARIYEDVAVEPPLPEAIQQRLDAVDSEGRLELVSEQVAREIGTRVQAVISGAAPEAMSWMQEGVFTGQLSSEHADWMRQSIEATVNIDSYGVRQAWSFAQSYAARLMHRVCVHMALGDGGEPVDGAEGLVSAAAMNGLRIISNKMGGLKEGQDLDTRLFGLLQEYHEAVEGAEKVARYGELILLLSPLADALLKSAGFESEEDLSIPAFLQAPVWRFVRERVFPGVLLGVYQDMRLHTTRHLGAQDMRGHDELESAIDTVTSELLPTLLSLLDNPEYAFASDLKGLLEEKNITAIPASWIQHALTCLANVGEGSDCQNALKILIGCVSGRFFDAATHLAVGEDNNPSKNILTNIVVNSLTVLQRHLSGQDEHLQAAIADCDRLEFVLGVLDSAQRVLSAKKKRPGSLGEKRIRQYADEALRACGIAEERKAELASYARRLLLKSSSHESDDDVIASLLFGSPLSSAANAHSQLSDKLKRTRQERIALLERSFTPIITDILSASGFGGDEAFGLPGLGVVYDLDAIRHELLPPLLLRLYREVTAPQGQLGHYQGVLRRLIQPASGQDQGLDEAADQLKEICCVVSQDVTNVVRSFFAENPEEVLEFIPPELSGMHSLIQEAVGEIAASDDPAIADAFKVAARFVEASVTKIFVNFARTTDSIFPVAYDESPQKMLGANLMIRMIGLLAQHGPAIRVRLRELKFNSLPEAEKARRTQDIFMPLSQELLEMSLPNGEDDLPLPVVMRDSAYALIEETVLPKVLAKMYNDIWGWDEEFEEAKSTLKQQFLSTHAFEYIHVMARLGADRVDQYLRAQSGDMAETVYETIRDYLVGCGVEGEALAGRIEGNRGRAVKLVETNIHQAFSYQDPALEQMWSVAHEYIENLVVRMQANVFGHISELEEGRSDYLIETALHVMGLFVKHFASINEVVKEKNAKHAFAVKPADMLESYNKRIDDKLKASPDYIRAKAQLYHAQEALRKGNFQSNRKAKELAVKEARRAVEEISKRELLTPLIDEFMDMAGFQSAEDMPFPRPLRGKMWNLCRERILPVIAGAILDAMTDPSTLNNLATVFIQTVNEALTVMPEAEPIDDDDETQRRMNESCGILVRQFIDLMPNDITGQVLHIDKIRNLTARTVGKAVREALSRWTIIKLVDLGMFSSLPAQLPGVWTGVDKEERFSPRVVVNGKITREAAPLKFNMPVTPQERKTADDAKRKSDRMAEERLRKLITHTLDEQVRGVVRNFINAQWSKFQIALDAFIEKHFSDGGLNAKHTMDFICRKIFINAFGSVIQLLIYPLYKAICFFVEFYYNKKGKDIVQNLHLDENGEFTRKLSLEIMHNLNMHRKGQRV